MLCKVMSILTTTKGINNKLLPENQAQSKLKPEDIFKTYNVSKYKPSTEEKTVREMIIKHFEMGEVTMRKPRVEFNDMSLVDRMMYDQMSFNTYQPNNGQGLYGDAINAWRSNAIRPVVRNKAISIAAHVTARLIFPKVFAYDKSDNEQKDAAMVMSDLMEWSADQSDYEHTSLQRVLSSLTDPASIGYTEYVETYRTIKTEKGEDGKWKTEKVLDDTLSGFQDAVVPANELFIENIFEPNIQKQGWLIWRKVISYSLAEAKYMNTYENFKYVTPGVQLIYSDANAYFYEVYDESLRQDNVEEICYWNRTLDIKIIMVNGVMMTESENPNPRIDKKYPFDKYYYEEINTNFFYGMSLSFKLQSDARIVNDLYPMIIDGTYLNVMPPMINSGGESITSDVVVPGVVTTLDNPNSSITPVNTSNNLKAGLDTLGVVENSLNNSSQEPQQSGSSNPGSQTAYEISRLEQNASTVLGLFLKMIAKHVKDFGKLRASDIIQYMTIADVDKLEDNGELVYKTFLLGEKATNGGTKTRKIKFDNTLPDEMDDDDLLKESYKTLENEDKYENSEIYRVNPGMFRKVLFEMSISPDVLNPKSADLEKAYNLEEYDRMIANPLANQEEAFRMLLGSYDATKRDPDKYIAEQGQEAMPGLPGLPQQMGAESPLASAMGQTPLPQDIGGKV